MGYDPSGYEDYMNPMDIRFSQDSIRAEFGDNSGRTIYDTIRELQEGTATADTIPAIKVLTSDFIIEHYAEYRSNSAYQVLGSSVWPSR